MIAERLDISLSLSEGRHPNGLERQPVVEVLPESALLHILFQIRVRGGYDPHIHLNRFLAAHALKLLVLQDAEDLGMELETVQQLCSKYNLGRKEVEK